MPCWAVGQPFGPGIQQPKSPFAAELPTSALQWHVVQSQQHSVDMDLHTPQHCPGTPRGPPESWPQWHQHMLLSPMTHTVTHDRRLHKALPSTSTTIETSIARATGG
uniref:Uncharacterized protein n=1 Tax=Eutreptiella gymnastica TaxID=73025 RepID=A0A7S4FQB7_9EUGL